MLCLTFVERTLHFITLALYVDTYLQLYTWCTCISLLRFIFLNTFIRPIVHFESARRFTITLNKVLNCIGQSIKIHNYVF